MSKPDDLHTLLYERGGLEGLARELGQHDPAARLYEPAANENKPVGLWRRLIDRLHNLSF